MTIDELPPALRARVRRGVVIPAHPLALTRNRCLDERAQRALTRYYLAAGAGGLAVGVHTTQFEIHDPGTGLLPPVWQLAAETVRAWSVAQHPPILLVAGVCGPTRQAVREALLARELGYHAALVSLASLRDAPLTTLLTHCRRVAEILPLFGFYLQPAVGGRVLPYEFWRRFAEIENVLAIKIAPFNRYRTLDVVRAVADAGRADEIALYTGNDDSLVWDLLTPFRLRTAGGLRTVRIVGGLLGQWAVWTRQAVALLDTIHAVPSAGPVPRALLIRAAELTDCNAAIFDAAHNFAGCLPGIHTVLHRQGLMPGVWCLDPNVRLSPGQAAEIERVCRAYPHLSDDAFVSAHLAEWRS